MTIKSWTGSLFAILLFVGVCLSQAQEVGGLDMQTMATEQLGLTGGGFTWIDGTPYFRTQLQPEATFGKIGIGLDLVLLLGNVTNEETGENEFKVLAENGEEWNSLSNYLRALRFIRYGQPAEPFYAHFGAFDYITIGHGFIMSGYSNHDRRGLRLNARLQNKFGIETVINDIGNPSVLGGRVYYRPLGRFELGGTYLTDTNPNLDNDLKTEEDPLVAMGVDIGIPIMSSDALQIDLYNDLVFLNTKIGSNDKKELAKGNASGIGLSAFKSIFKLEYRIFGEKFIPTIFDHNYDVLAPTFLGLDETKDGVSRKGFYSLITSHILPKVNLIGTFESYSDGDPKMYLGISEDGLIDKLSFRAFYTKRNIGQKYIDNDGKEVDPDFFEDIARLDEKSAFTVRLGYEIISAGVPLEFNIIRQYTFQQMVDDNGEKSFKPIKTTSFEIGVKLDF